MLAAIAASSNKCMKRDRLLRAAFVNVPVCTCRACQHLGKVTPPAPYASVSKPKKRSYKMAKRKSLPPERHLTIPYNGKTYYVSYTVEKDYLTMRCGKEEKTAKLSGLSVESLSTLLLAELDLEKKLDFKNPPINS